MFNFFILFWLLQGVHDIPNYFTFHLYLTLFALFIYFKCCDRSALGRRGNGVVCNGFGYLSNHTAVVFDEEAFEIIEPKELL